MESAPVEIDHRDTTIDCYGESGARSAQLYVISSDVSAASDAEHRHVSIDLVSEKLNCMCNTSFAGRSRSIVERWLAKFEHRDKWNFCLNSAIMPLNRRAYDEAYPP